MFCNIHFTQPTNIFRTGVVYSIFFNDNMHLLFFFFFFTVLVLFLRKYQNFKPFGSRHEQIIRDYLIIQNIHKLIHSMERVSSSENNHTLSSQHELDKAGRDASLPICWNNEMLHHLLFYNYVVFWTCFLLKPLKSVL